MDAEYHAREDTDVTRADPGVSIAAMMPRKVVEVKLTVFHLFALYFSAGFYLLLA
jgi:hypothetical protein